jgi:hypothetical protein
MRGRCIRANVHYRPPAKVGVQISRRSEHYGVMRHPVRRTVRSSPCKCLAACGGTRSPAVLVAHHVVGLSERAPSRDRSATNPGRSTRPDTNGVAAPKRRVLFDRSAATRDPEIDPVVSVWDRSQPLRNWFKYLCSAAVWGLRSALFVALGGRPREAFRPIRRSRSGRHHVCRLDR